MIGLILSNKTSEKSNLGTKTSLSVGSILFPDVKAFSPK